MSTEHATDQSSTLKWRDPGNTKYICMAISVLGHKEDALPCLVLLQLQDPMGFWKPWGHFGSSSVNVDSRGLINSLVAKKGL